MAGNLIPRPYIYPHSKHIRRHGPRGWTDYQRYRPWLRDEFVFRCVYCLERELWRDMRQKMHIDHLQPQKLRKDLVADYENLLYLCPSCNFAKRDFLLPDPCELSLGECLRIHDDGSIEAINNNAEGLLIIEVLALNEPVATAHRRRIIGIVRSLAESDWRMFVGFMGYPEDLPDLSAMINTPPHNSKPDSVKQSHYEKKLRGELPDVY